MTLGCPSQGLHRCAVVGVNTEFRLQLQNRSYRNTGTSPWILVTEGGALEVTEPTVGEVIPRRRIVQFSLPLLLLRLVRQRHQA